MTRKMICYLRRSKANKKRPEDPAYCIEAQRTAIERSAELHDWEIVWAPEDDGVTGAHPPG
jgi:DNA invertase Pin-like site-specific DNA recombinase